MGVCTLKGSFRGALPSVRVATCAPPTVDDGDATGLGTRPCRGLGRQLFGGENTPKTRPGVRATLKAIPTP